MTRRLASRPLPLATIVATILAVGACDLSALEPSATPASVTPAPTTSGPPTFVRPTPAPLPTFLTYVVVRGDTLSSIAKTFGTSAQSLAYWNRAAHPTLDPESSQYDPNDIKVGWTLILIPFAEVDPEALPPASALPTQSTSPSPGA